MSCGRMINGGPGAPPGEGCIGGMWIYWATAYDKNGKDMYGKPVRWAKRCTCRGGGSL